MGILMRATFLILLLAGGACADDGINLGGGIVTRTNVQGYADLSLDLRDISGLDDSEAILGIYTNGQNAESEPGYKLTLKSLNQNLGKSVVTPQYVYHLYGLAGLSLDPEKIKSHEQYANVFIQTLTSKNPGLAPEAIKALTLWMYGVHLVNWGADLCFKRSVADDPNALETLVGGGLDEFIALWIGQDQTPGNSDGHSLYSWAQDAGALFSTSSGEATVNSALKLLYQDGAGILSFRTACSRQNSASVKDLWTVSQQMISNMFIPQIQMLIHSLLSKDEDAVSIYALAVVPQISQCRPSVFKRLNSQLLGDSVNFDKTSEYIRELESVYDCFGLTCADIGSYLLGGYECAPEGLGQPLAGIVPTSPVQELAKLDLDILQIKILTALDHFRFARYIYLFGRNSPQPRDSINDPYALRSLRSLAVTNERRKSDPIYSYFVSYFNDVQYADTAVDAALRGVGKWTSVEQRSELVVTTSAFQIVFLYMLSKLKESVSVCQSAHTQEWLPPAISPWDEVVALLIGSLEGPFEGGSSDQDDGQLHWNLAHRRAFQFQTLNDVGNAKVNDELEDLLFAGIGEYDALDCENLERTASRIRKIVLVPLIQSALRYAMMAEKLEANSDSPALVLGETFAMSVLPMLSTVDVVAAQVIRENMEVKKDVKPMKDGPQAVADAFGICAVEWGLECRALGSASRADPCRLYDEIVDSEGTSRNSSSAISRKQFSWTWTALASTFAGTVFLLTGL